MTQRYVIVKPDGIDEIVHTANEARARAIEIADASGRAVTIERGESLVNVIVPGHHDTHQTYEDGEFVTHCSCGTRFLAADPDGADFRCAEHVGAALDRLMGRGR